MNSNMPLILFLIVISTMLGSVGSLLFKLSANQLVSLERAFSKGFLFRFVFGAFVFVISVLMYTFLLKIVDLSFLFPFIGLSYIWTNLLSIIILKERVSKKSWMGITLIIIGVTLVSVTGI